MSFKLYLTFGLLLGYCILMYLFPILHATFEKRASETNPQLVEKMEWWFKIVRKLPAIMAYSCLAYILLVWMGWTVIPEQ